MNVSWNPYVNSQWCKNLYNNNLESTFKKDIPASSLSLWSDSVEISQLAINALLAANKQEKDNASSEGISFDQIFQTALDELESSGEITEDQEVAIEKQLDEMAVSDTINQDQENTILYAYKIAMQAYQKQLYIL